MMNKLLWKILPRSLSISRSEIHVWKIYLSCIKKEYKSRIDILSKEEYKYLNSFKFKKDRFRYEITHCMKRWVLAGYLNESPEKLNFTLGEQGKTEISAKQNWLNLQFNISYSHQLILMAITVEDAIGIDVEYHTDTISVENMSKIVFSPIEKRFFSKLITQQEKREFFFRCWTRKEAYLKAKGMGLINCLSEISIGMNKFPADNWLKSPMIKKDSSRWKLFPLFINESYTASIVGTTDQYRLSGYKINATSNDLLSQY